MAQNERKPYSSHAEVLSPITTRVEGEIPSWLRGSLVRIGPGLFNFGKHEAIYPMDGMGLLHSFHIEDGQVTFKSKYILSEIYKKNMKAERYVAAEFGTPLNPDPNQSVFAKLKQKVAGGELSDNCNHNIFYWKECNVLMVSGLPFFAIDPLTLDTIAAIKLPEKLAVDLVCEHVHLDKDGTLYILGSHVRGKPAYHVIKVVPTGDVVSSFEGADIVFTVNGQFKMTPTTHHNFVMTDNFFVIIECPLQVNILKIITKGTILEALSWEPSVTCKFHVYNRKSGQLLKQKVESNSFFLLHFANAYEDGNFIVLDSIIFNKFAIKDMFTPRKVLASHEYQDQTPWSKLDIDKPVRFVIPTNTENLGKKQVGDNIVDLPGEQAEAVVQKSCIQLKFRPLTASREDVEHINYPCINPAWFSKPYNYFYAGGNGESEFLKFGIGKYNVHTMEVKTWEAEIHQYLSEPVFIADPQATEEDHGVLLFTMQDYKTNEDRLIIVDAKTMATAAQIYLDAQNNIPVWLPEGDHGVFIPSE